MDLTCIPHLHLYTSPVYLVCLTCITALVGIAVKTYLFLYFSVQMITDATRSLHCRSCLSHVLHAGWFLVCLYSVTAPIGIAIGIGIAEGYDSQSTAALATQVRTLQSARGKDLGISLCQYLGDLQNI